MKQIVESWCTMIVPIILLLAKNKKLSILLHKTANDYHLQALHDDIITNGH